MKKNHNTKNNQATLDMQLAMDLSFKAMEPYMSIIESNIGELAMLLVSGAASANAAGVGCAKDLEATIQKASSMTYIPAEVFRTYAKSTTAMMSCFKLEGCYD